MDAVKTFLDSRYTLWMLLGLPFAWMVYAYPTERIFYGELLHASGELSARLLMVALAATPLRLMLPDAKWPRWFVARRRYFGVAAFVYAMLHTVVYLQRKGVIAEIIDEGLQFNMWTGWLALVIFALLAATSNDASVRLLKRAWSRFHRLVYPAALLTFLHWVFSAFNFVPGLIHAAVLAALEVYRVRRTRRQAQG